MAAPQARAAIVNINTVRKTVNRRAIKVTYLSMPLTNRSSRTTHQNVA
jgi:hypothetical protein